MRIAILALGSRGDIQPYIALGKGLLADGHIVRLVTHDNYEKLVTAHGCEFWPMRGNVQEFTESAEMRALLEKGNFIAIMGHAAKAAKVAARNWAKEGLTACQGMDLIVAGLGGLYIGVALCEKLALPLMQAYYVPFTPTNTFAGALAPAWLARLGKVANRFSHHLTRQMMWQQIRGADQAARQQVLELPAAPFWGPYNSPCLQSTPILYGFSPAVIAKPPEWGKDLHITGYWFLESEKNWFPPAALEEFLGRGPAPLYIGFGSMSSRKPVETAHLILKAVVQTGQRAVILSGWGGLKAENLPDNVFVIDSVPHDWLFERVAAVVHHGGAGTTAAGLRAGVPSIIIPFFADQPFWGQRVAALGVGPQPIPRQQLTQERLAQAIQQAMGDATMRQRAAALGRNIRAEDGIGQAVKVIKLL
jgi:UDP:flavonoid glycosyltransferase YjiC (YdhE family)